MRITEEDLDQLYYDAFLTDQRLPNAMRKQKLTFWMDMNRIDWLNYGDSEPKISLSPRSISRWELALQLIQLIKDEEDRKIIWLRSKRLSWSKIGRQTALDRRKVKNKYSEILMNILAKIKFTFNVKEKQKIYRLISPKYD
jgi:hypothetical protein|tara:strand:+ start:365 stop:787 length:423 start_codon:yes stop_codon:yes gene_type:complete